MTSPVHQWGLRFVLGSVPFLHCGGHVVMVVIFWHRLRVQVLPYPNTIEPYIHLSSSSGSVASGRKWWLMIACLSWTGSTSLCILSTTKSFGRACWRKPMPSKDGLAPQPRALMLSRLCSCWAWQALPTSQPRDCWQLCWIQAMPLGASEPLSPSWASAINIYCGQGCIGPLGGTQSHLARGGPGRAGQRYALAMILLQGLVESPNKIWYCGQSLLRGQRREKTILTFRLRESVWGYTEEMAWSEALKDG